MCTPTTGCGADGGGKVKKTVVLTRDGMAEARQVRDHLCGLGYRVATVPTDICLWDEAALSAWAAP